MSQIYTPETEPSPLADASSLEELSRSLNEEADQSHLVLTFAPAVGDNAPGQGINGVFYAFEDPDIIKKLGLLSVKPVPAGARGADADAAQTPEAKQAVKDAYLAFMSPLLENHVALCRAEVFINKQITEVVLLREAEQYQPSSLNGTLLAGGEDWEWLVAEVVGDDIVVHGSHSTTFGGSNDTSDNGLTGSGYATRGHPNLKACSLPLGGYASTTAELRALEGTPLPKLPFGLDRDGNDRAAGAHVEVFDPKNPQKKFIYPVIDLGPAKRTKHALDLTVAAARDFIPTATANNFSMVLEYRIIKGALGLPAELRTPRPKVESSVVATGTNKVIFDSVLQNVGFSTAHAPGTAGGTLACAWAVNRVVELSQLHHPIGGETSTAEMFAKLNAGAGKAINEGQAMPGTIIISPTEGSQHGHVGILGSGDEIYSNSSADRQFKKNWVLGNWKKYYSGKGLKVLFYDIVA